MGLTWTIVTLVIALAITWRYLGSYMPRLLLAVPLSGAQLIERVNQAKLLRSSGRLACQPSPC
jgi:hypothetical protein